MRDNIYTKVLEATQDNGATNPYPENTPEFYRYELENSNFTPDEIELVKESLRGKITSEKARTAFIAAQSIGNACIILAAFLVLLAMPMLGILIQATKEGSFFGIAIPIICIVFASTLIYRRYGRELDTVILHKCDEYAHSCTREKLVQLENALKALEEFQLKAR